MLQKLLLMLGKEEIDDLSLCSVSFFSCISLSLLVPLSLFLFVSVYLPPFLPSSLPLLFSVEIYGRMSTDLLPTPAKSHYIFNLRDLSKCIQGSVNHLNSSSLYSTLPHSLHVTVKLFFLSSSYLPFSLSLPLSPSLLPFLPPFLIRCFTS